MQTFSYCIVHKDPAEVADKESVTKQCLSVANQASFSTNFKDCFDHLFNDDENRLCFAYRGMFLCGFAIFSNSVNQDKSTTMYLSGMVIHPKCQSVGMGRDIVDGMVKKYAPKYLLARTHNPRMYELITSFAIDDKSYYPHHDRLAPTDILGVIRGNVFTESADERLIVRDAYDDEKISQSTRNRSLAQELFRKLGANDAFAVIAKLY